MNKILLCGRLVTDPELKYAASGNGVCTFRLVTNEKFKDKESSSFHTIKVFGRPGESCKQYLYKGRQALIEGRIDYSTSEANGVKTYWTAIIADKVEFLSDGKGEAKSIETPELPPAAAKERPISHGFYDIPPGISTQQKEMFDDVPF